MAFVAAGEEGNTPDHEDFTHGVAGTDEAVGHQDPVVIIRTEIRCSWRTLFLPEPVRIQYRYYPYTVKQDGTIPNREAVEARIAEQVRQLRRRRQQAYHASMPRWMERRAWNQETNKQRGRGVPGFRLRRRQDSRVEAFETRMSGLQKHSVVNQLPNPQNRSKVLQRAAKRPARAKRATRACRTSSAVTGN